jgi:hypothetical protein
MTISSDSLRRIAVLGLTAEQMCAVLSIIADAQAPIESRRQKDRERKRNVPRNVRGHSAENPETIRGKVMENPPTPRVPEPAHVFSISEEVKNIPLSPPSEVRPPKDVSVGKPRTSPKATRVPEDFDPDEASTRFGVSLGLRRDEICGEGRREFLDYWRGVPGVKGTKTDWQGTFRNSLKRFRPDRPSGFARAGPIPFVKPASSKYQAVKILLEEARSREKSDIVSQTIDGDYTVEPSGQHDDLWDAQRG